MKVKLLTIYSTLRRAYQAGAVIDLPDADAIRLVERFLAVPVREAEIVVAEPAVERAVVRRVGERRSR